jgi:hypothetical protein
VDSSRKNRSNFEKFDKNPLFSHFIKAYPLAIALYTVLIFLDMDGGGGKLSRKNITGGFRMRANRVLVPKGRYWVSTDVNNREAVFRQPWAVQM